ncbi:fatty acid--CoA ligase [Kribbella antibiotica]|uniref:Fatty acid--CoA ligase n=1 Tax=Kribbella antibiotica TaxID=190195 RepID=A0A4R4YMS2_9ACTN|nr:AMP-binding protein [Kribbella antibiotica]TDD44802.1 fatty acid--CoA ligase [Kribbella antibiotica]
MPSPCLADAVAVHGVHRPHRTALVFNDRTVTYGELIELTQDYRGRLIELELPAGSTVCVPAHKSPETIALLLAAFHEGLVVLAPAPDLGAAALARLSQQARATHVLTATDVLTAEPVEGDETAAAGFSKADPKRTCLLLTTSGSTGTPKIVPIAATGFDAFAAWATAEFALSADDVALSYAPLNFDLALLDIWTFLQLGAQVVLVDQGKATDGAYVHAQVADHDVTFVQGVPMLYRLLTEAGTTFPSVREVIFTGDSVPAALLEPVSVDFPKARFHNIFGCTETNDSFIYEVDPAKLNGKMPIGRPIAGTDALVSEAGELLVATPFQTDGYLNSTLNADTFTVIDGRTFYRTGDLVTRDDDGLYSLQGRADWQVKVRGVRTNLQEVEQVISAHPEVLEAVVVPLPDEQAGVRLHAHVSRHPSSTLTSLRLRSHAGEHLPRHAIPTSVHITDVPLPRTSTGKPDRNLIKSNRLKEILT